MIALALSLMALAGLPPGLAAEDRCDILAINIVLSEADGGYCFTQIGGIDVGPSGERWQWWRMGDFASLEGSLDVRRRQAIFWDRQDDCLRVVRFSSVRIRWLTYGDPERADAAAFPAASRRGLARP